MRLKGGCHCGNIKVEFTTRRPLADIEVRACGCSFCRQHGARSATDRDGKLVIYISSEANLNKYRFGLKLTDFLICTNCGAYVVAAVEHQGQYFATLNINTLNEAKAFTRKERPVDYSGETPEDRLTRRIQNFTPMDIKINPG